MTEEKAIEILQGAIKKPNTKDGYLGQAIDMAIKALERELATKNDLGVDCISRESVLKLIYDYKENHSNDREHYPINYGTLLDIIRWVLKLPPVTPQELRKGHWVESHDDWGNGIITDKRYKCSVCHGKHIDQKTREWHEVFDYKYPFCPNCGAKMSESEE